MNNTQIKQAIKQCVNEGQAKLNEASAYLSTYANDWSDTHEENWQGLIRQAEILLIKSLTLKELIDPKGPLQ